MKRAVIPLAIGLGLVLAVVALLQTQQRERAGFAAPSFRLPTLDGRTVRLEEFRGKILFLNFWATWCPPCREEMPAMQRVYERFRQRPFAMLAVSEDTSAEPVREFVNALGLSFSIALDPNGQLPEKYGVTGYPETFIIDPSGIVLRHVVGPLEWDHPDVIRYFEELLAAVEKQTPPAAGQVVGAQ
ncbi:MAG: thioredoxin [Candidatus Binatia bacterium]|nr:MAG: thioredoxin [Candidatus Binatia bacterium]